jgi:hypothetical protein
LGFLNSADVSIIFLGLRHQHKNDKAKEKGKGRERKGDGEAFFTFFQMDGVSFLDILYFARHRQKKNDNSLQKSPLL